MRYCRYIPLLIVVLCLPLASFAKEAHVLYCYYQTKYTDKENAPEGGGIWIGTSGHDKGRIVWGDRSKQVLGAWFSPDGKKIGFSHNGLLYVINNDGSNEQTYDLGPTFPPANQDNWYYTGNAAVWRHEDILYRYDIQTQTLTPHRCNDIGVVRRIVRASNDGRKVFCVNGKDASGNRTGNNRLFEFSEDFSSLSCRILAPLDHACPPYVEVGDAIWGHGNAITPDGEYVLMNEWCGYKSDVSCPKTGGSTHRSVGVFSTTQDEHLYSVCVGPIVGEDGLNMKNWESPEAVVNSSDHIVFDAGSPYKPGTYRSYVIDWKNREHVATVPHPHAAALQNAWLGPLPAPTDAPALELDKGVLQFAAEEQNPAIQQVTVSRTDGTVPAQVQAVVDPADTRWLSIQPSASDGAVVLANSVSVAELPDGEYRATVSVAAADIAQAQSYEVILYKGQTMLLPPTDITALNSGDSLTAVSLSWNGQAPDVGSIRIERRFRDGSWTLAAQAESAGQYVDSAIPPGIYEYRLAACKAGACSAWSDAVQVQVTGVEWIRLDSIGGNCVLMGNTSTVYFTTNRVTDVVIEYSLDGGRTWTVGNGGTGSVSASDGDWGRFAWQVPGVTADAAMLRLHPYGESEPAVKSARFAITGESCPTAAAGNADAHRAFIRGTDVRILRNRLTVTISRQGHYHLRLVNSAGKTVTWWKGAGPGSISLQPHHSALSPGYYLLEINEGVGKNHRVLPVLLTGK